MTERKFLTKEDIALISDIKVEEVAVPEWGGVICMKEMNGVGRDAFEKEVTARTGKSSSMDCTGLRPLLLSLVLCDSAGTLLYEGDEGIKILNEKSAKVIGRLFDLAQKMNNIGEEALEQAEKNS